MRQVTFPIRLRGARREAVKEQFWFPLPTAVRTALIETGFRAGPNMRAFTAEEMALVREFGPEAIVLPLGLALSLGDQKQRGLFSLASLNTAIVVLTSIDDSPLTDAHRDILWSAFGVPIFEQLRGADGAVIARECEVHDGLHLVGTSENLGGDAIPGHCACGSDKPRLRHVRPVREQSAAA